MAGLGCSMYVYWNTIRRSSDDDFCHLDHSVQVHFVCRVFSFQKIEMTSLFLVLNDVQDMNPRSSITWSCLSEGYSQVVVILWLFLRPTLAPKNETLSEKWSELAAFCLIKEQACFRVNLLAFVICDSICWILVMCLLHVVLSLADDLLGHVELLVVLRVDT